MIVVDTSALMAMLAGETLSEICTTVFEREDPILISASTLVEALIVANRRGFLSSMHELLASPAIEVIEVNEERAHLAAAAYARWGKGFHPAGLNFGDCFAYALARERDCTLLYVGNDFSLTDIRSAIPRL